MLAFKFFDEPAATPSLLNGIRSKEKM